MFSSSQKIILRCIKISNTPITGNLFSNKRESNIDVQHNKIKEGPGLEYFLANTNTHREGQIEKKQKSLSTNRKVFLSTYGCQMNVNDSEIVHSILSNAGYTKTDDVKESNVALLMTCSIREGAEQKIWKHLDHLKQIRKHQQRTGVAEPLKIGLLGCMAERLKTKILEKDQSVDVVCGPDAYRDLPRLLETAQAGQSAVNVQLSLEETYADILPVRLAADSRSAYVSIMRGCDNMCTYCIVPFTRGRERSRQMESIIDEVQHLSSQGVKEVVLLGQNVNSYRDTSVTTALHAPTPLAKGFSTVYKAKVGGRRFTDLLDRVSQVDPEMRIRFTSPHPKDFPDEVLDLIKSRPNICRQLHLPAQSGSSRILAAMGRGYTRETYIELVENIRTKIPDVSLSSDFIAGFCGETPEDHQDSVSLLRLVRYNFAFCFPYSMREKTRAYHRLSDNVDETVKSERHMELVQVFRDEALKLNQSCIGSEKLVLVDGESKRSADAWSGRSDENTKVIFPKRPPTDEPNTIKPGDYVVVKITGASSQVLHGTSIEKSTLSDYHKKSTWNSPRENHTVGL